MLWYEIITIILALCGFYVANKIRVEKKKGKKMICPLNGKCEEILNSDFAKFAGIPLEIAGVGYYLTVIFANIIFIFLPSLKFSLLEIILFGITFFSFVFSLYLTSIQAFLLKNWCTWCLYSALFSILIFLTSAINFNLNLIKIIPTIILNPWFFVLVNIISYAIGTSIAIILEIITLKYLKDFKIDHKEKIVLMYLWQILWSMIFLIIISSFTIIFLKINIYETQAIFNIKTIIFSLIVFLSAMMSFYILPKLDKSKIDCHVINVFSISLFRNVAIIFSSLILGSWIIIIFINQVLNCFCDYTKFLTFYLILIPLLIFLLIWFLNKKTLDKKKEKRDNI